MHKILVVFGAEFGVVALAKGPRRVQPGGSLSGGYAPDSAKAEGSSIVDEPGEG